MKDVSKGYIYGLASAVIFSVVSILGKVLMRKGVEPGILIFWQYAGVLTVLALYFYYTKTSIKISSIYVPLVGIFSITANLFFYLSMDLIGAGLATLILYFSSVFTALFFFISGIRGIKKLEWFAIFLALLGSALSLEIFSGIRLDILGIGLGVLAAMAYALYGIGLDLKLGDEKFLLINFYIALQGIIIISLLNFSQDLLPWRIEFRDIVYLLILGISAGTIPNYLGFSSIRLIGAEKTSVVMSMELPATVLMAFFFLRETMGWVQALGIVFVLASVLLLRSLESPSQ